MLFSEEAPGPDSSILDGEVSNCIHVNAWHFVEAAVACSKYMYRLKSIIRVLLACRRRELEVYRRQNVTRV